MNTRPVVRIIGFITMSMLAFIVMAHTAHAMFSYSQAPQVSVSGQSPTFDHQSVLRIVSTESQDGVVVVITPTGTTTSTGSYPINFLANKPQPITYNQLLANTLYTVKVTHANGVGSNGYIVMQTLDSFRTLANPAPQTTPTTPTTPTTSTPITPTTTTTTPSTNNNNNNTSTPITPTTSVPQTQPVAGTNQCNNGIDDNGDLKADTYGVDTNKDGIIDIEPDPSCFAKGSTKELNDDVKSSIIPCTDKCSFTDIFRLLNNALQFFITQLLIPIFVIIIMYAGYQYLTAEGNPSKIANIKKMLQHIVLGILLILTSWLIVRTIMTTLVNKDFQEGAVQFLEE